MMSPAVAFFAATLTARSIRDGRYELLTLTTLSDAVIVRSYMLSALYHVRLLLALTLGLTPAMAVSMLDSALQAAIFQCQPDFSLKNSFQPGYTNCALPSATVSLMWWLIALGLWGFNLVAVAVGVGVALWSRNTMVAAVFAPLVTSLLSSGLFWKWIAPLSFNSTGMLLWIARLAKVTPGMWLAALSFTLVPGLITGPH